MPTSMVDEGVAVAVVAGPLVGATVAPGVTNPLSASVTFLGIAAISSVYCALVLLKLPNILKDSVTELTTAGVALSVLLSLSTAPAPPTAASRIPSNPLLISVITAAPANGLPDASNPN